MLVCHSSILLNEEVKTARRDVPAYPKVRLSVISTVKVIANFSLSVFHAAFQMKFKVADPDMECICDEKCIVALTCAKSVVSNTSPIHAESDK